NRSETAFYRKMLIITMLVGMVPAVWSELSARTMTPIVWWCVIGSGTCAAVYLFALARAYESSDFTIVYPVARSLPVIFVAVIDVLRGRYLTPLGWVGISLVVIGCVLVPLRSLKAFKLSNYFNRASLWMLLAAMGTVGYTFLDKMAAEVVQQGPDSAARYGVFYFAISFVPYTIFLRAFGYQGSKNTAQDWRLAVIAALFGFGAYWLVLWVYQLTPNASYVVAFRQFSIVIGAIVAFIVYKEAGVKVRLTGAALITSGLVLIGGWGR
ncbi:MAG: EamA family transporter, partial [Chloroflexi bacterium]|nr:EamA family transporter [Chloroflexota bacterium]